jgi:mono/diheme cytochrome c family protein
VRRPSLIAAGLLCAAVVAGCGSEGVVSPTASTVVGKQPKAPTFPIVAAYKLKGDPNKGTSVYSSAGCGSCHTLAAAGSTGTVGPNLDSLKPDYRAVTAQVTNGGGSMPAFKDTLSTQQIADVSEYVVQSTNKSQ